MKENSTPTKLETIKQRAEEYFSNLPKQEQFSHLVFKKAWIYQAKCAVVDFKYKNVHFAFNIYASGSNTVHVDLLQRASSTKFRLNGEFNTHKKLFQNVELLVCFQNLQAVIASIIDEINTPQEKKSRANKKPLNVGILTLPMNKNYGGNLQAYALMEVIETLGQKAVFVNRRFHHAHAKPSKQKYVKSVGLSPSVANKKFLDTYFPLITKPFFHSHELESDINEYGFDALIVGSDQVWRPQYAKEILNDFFFDFLPENSEIKRLSYAASFGSDKWEYDESRQAMASRLLKRFDAVGVREDAAVTMCAKELSSNATHVLDPTMLLDAQHYANKFNLDERRTSNDYLLNYVLDINDDKELVIKNLSNTLGLDALSVNGKLFERVNALNSSDGDQSVEGWLASFYKAKYIVTDSFHGVAFSILFNKPFLAYANPARGMARFTSLLNMFGLQDRLVTSSTQVTKSSMLAPIKWDSVNHKLNEMRLESLTFLVEALGISKELIANLTYTNKKKSSQLNVVQESSAQHIKRYVSESPIIINVREFPSKQSKTEFNIEDVLKSDMCIGCGGCAFASDGALSLEESELGAPTVSLGDVSALPANVKTKINAICPFSDKSLNEDQLDAPYERANLLPFNEVVGRYNALFAGRQSDEQSLIGSSSGGLTSWLTKKLLGKGLIDGVVHVGKAACEGDLFEYRISKTQDELDSNRKSNYYPTTLANVLKEVSLNSNKRYAIVGVPCFIKSARLLCEDDEGLKSSLKYFIGIVCGHMKTRFFAESNAWQLGVAPSEVQKVDFRKKIPNTKVGNYHFSVTSKDNEEKSAQPTSLLGGNWGHAFFQPNACNYCADIFAETADIVFGDAWLPKFNDEWRGTNIVVSRNPELTKLFENGGASGELTTENLSLNEIIQTQFGGISHRRHGLVVRTQDDEQEGRSFPSKRIDPKKVNLPFWRVELLRQRRKMSVMSGRVFAEAKDKGDLRYFLDLMSSETAVYRYIESLKSKL